MKKALILSVSILILNGCWPFPRKMKIDDLELRPLIEAAKQFDRKVYGFSDLPDSGDVRLETNGDGRYNAMLHFELSKPHGSRTIAFKKIGEKFVWIGEQEIFYGPNQYETPDGTVREQICLTFDKENISGAPLDSLYITYRGDNAELKPMGTISRKQSEKWKNRWGY